MRVDQGVDMAVTLEMIKEARGEGLLRGYIGRLVRIR